MRNAGEATAVAPPPRRRAAVAPVFGARVAAAGHGARVSISRALASARRTTAVVLLLATCVLAAPAAPRAQGNLDADARGVLDSMSAYLGSLPRFSVTYSAVDEVITTDGQKLQFLHGGELVVQRPDRLRAVRRGAAGTAEMVLDGRELILFGREANAFLRLPAPNIATAVEAVHGLGFEAPGADLLAERPLDSATTDMVSGVHVGMTFIDGVEVHQLALRGAEVDWQVWVMAGDRPLPLRYVITSKTIAGEPQYTLQLRDWNVAPQVEPGRFAFAPPPGARQLDPSAVTANAIGDMVIR